MANWDEHSSEIEVLQSIFIHDGEFELIKTDNPAEFNLNLVPYPEGDCENFTGLTFNVKYTEEYPNAQPIWTLVDVKGLDDDMIAELNTKISASFDENVGMICVYQVSDVINEFLRQNNRPLLTMHDKMLQRLGQTTGPAAPNREDYDSDSDSGIDEPEFLGLEMKKLCAPSERVKTQEFTTWADAFKTEMENKKIWRAIVNHDRPTGREQFESNKNLAQFDADDVLAHLAAAPKVAANNEDAEAERFLAENKALFHVDEEAMQNFDDEEDFDLDDLSDD